MPEETTPATDNSSVNATINAVAGLAQAIPVYQDALQPAAKEVGKSLEVVAKVIGIALSPLKGVVWGYEKIEGFITESVGERLKNVPVDNIVTPALNIVGPAIEALKFSGNDVNLRELYANLIANAMDKTTNLRTHPAFVEIIRTISGDEALLLKHLSTDISEPLVDAQLQQTDNSGYNNIRINHSIIGKRLEFSEEKNLLVPSYLDNLCRLGLLEIPSGVLLSNEEVYDEVESDLEPIKKRVEANHSGRLVTYSRKMIQLTNFGKLFIELVVKDKI